MRRTAARAGAPGRTGAGTAGRSRPESAAAAGAPAPAPAPAPVPAGAAHRVRVRAAARLRRRVGHRPPGRGDAAGDGPGRAGPAAGRAGPGEPGVPVGGAAGPGDHPAGHAAAWCTTGWWRTCSPPTSPSCRTSTVRSTPRATPAPAVDVPALRASPSRSNSAGAAWGNRDVRDRPAARGDRVRRLPLPLEPGGHPGSRTPRPPALHGADRVPGDAGAGRRAERWDSSTGSGAGRRRPPELGSRGRLFVRRAASGARFRVSLHGPMGAGRTPAGAVASRSSRLPGSGCRRSSGRWRGRTGVADSGLRRAAEHLAEPVLHGHRVPRRPRRRSGRLLSDAALHTSGPPTQPSRHRGWNAPGGTAVDGLGAGSAARAGGSVAGASAQGDRDGGGCGRAGGERGCCAG